MNNHHHKVIHRKLEMIMKVVHFFLKIYHSLATHRSFDVNIGTYDETNLHGRKIALLSCDSEVSRGFDLMR